MLGLLLSVFIIPLTVNVSDAQFLKKRLDKCRKDHQEYKDKVLDIIANNKGIIIIIDIKTEGLKSQYKSPKEKIVIQNSFF